MIKKKWLLDPNSFSFAHLEKDSENAEWYTILSWFVEVIQDHLLFLRAMQVETHTNFKTYFSTRQMLLRTTFEDRLQIFLARDQDQASNLIPLWP